MISVNQGIGTSVPEQLEKGVRGSHVSYQGGGPFIEGGGGWLG